jgi:hypothetical protein
MLRIGGVLLFQYVLFPEDMVDFIFPFFWVPAESL